MTELTGTPQATAAPVEPAQASTPSSATPPPATAEPSAADDWAEAAKRVEKRSSVQSSPTPEQPSEPPKEPAQEQAPQLPEMVSRAELAKAISEGKHADALRMLGLDPAAVRIKGGDWVEFRRQTHEFQRQQETATAAMRELEQEVMQSRKARELQQSGDYLGALEAIFGEDWDRFSVRVIEQRQNQDPRMRQMQREMEELKAERQRQLEQATQHQQAAARQAAFAQQSQYIANELKAPPELTQSPMWGNLVQQMVQIAERMDPDQREQVTVKELAIHVMNGGKQFIDHYHGIERFLTGQQIPSQGNAAPPTPQQQPDRPAPASVPITRSTAGSADSVREMTDEEHDRHWASVFHRRSQADLQSRP